MSAIKARLTEKPGRGRCLVATSAIKAGQVVVKESAQFVQVLSGQSRLRSHWSLWQADAASANGLKRCSRTKFAHYVSTEEQKLDWLDGYREQSAWIASASHENKVAPSLARMAARVWVQSAKDPFTKKLVSQVASNLDQLGPEKLETLKALAAGTCEAMNVDQTPKLPVLPKPVPHLLLPILAKLWTNTHTIVDCEINAVGLGLFLEYGCFANHSDSPNCTQVFELRSGQRPIMRFVAARDIAPGDEICISYVDLSSGFLERHMTLATQYRIPYPKLSLSQVEVECALFASIANSVGSNFKCSFVSMPGRELDDAGEAASADSDDSVQIVIQKSPVGSFELTVGLSGQLVIPGQSPSERRAKLDAFCGENLDTLIKHSISAAMPQLSVAHEVKRVSNDLEALQRSMLMLLSRPYSGCCTSLALAVSQRQLKSTIEQGDFEQALDLAQGMTPHLAKRYPASSPLLGLHYATCAKLSFYFNKTVLAKRFAAKALPVLEMNYGIQGEFLGPQRDGLAMFCLLKDINSLP